MTDIDLTRHRSGDESGAAFLEESDGAIGIVLKMTQAISLLIDGPYNLPLL